MSQSDVLAQSTGGAHFDYIIVGGGSAGCVMAARLSENKTRKVALIESGPDFLPGEEPDFVRDPRTRALFAFPLFWPGLLAETVHKIGSLGPLVSPMPQARVVGGTSMINGMHAQRGEPSDYDEWKLLGVTGWGWKDVVPYFVKVEGDSDYPSASAQGPVKIKRYGPSTWSALSQALRQEFEARGVPLVQNVNAQGGDSIAPVPLNATTQRWSAAAAYLTSQVRARSNLKIIANTSVKRITFDGQRATGVELLQPQDKHILGSTVIVCAGALHSPAVLQRSGIGPGALLSAAGIHIVADRNGVGRRLQNHPTMNAVTAHLTRAARSTGRAPAPCLMLVRYSSLVPDCPRSDMLINLWERIPGPSERDPLLNHFANFMLILNKSFSEGEVTINPAKPYDVPTIQFNLLSDERDRRRMIDGARMLALLTKSPAFDGLITDRLSLKPGPMMMMMMQSGWKSKTMSALGSFALSIPGLTRRKVLDIAGVAIDALVGNANAFEQYVLSSTLAGGHATGSCRMGDPEKDDTVIDSRCRVVGIEGVRVVDASIFPTPLRAGTNLPTMMAAEKAATMIIEDALNER